MSGKKIGDRYDGYRKKYLEAFGIVVLEFWNNEVERDMDKVVEKLLLRIGPGDEGFGIRKTV